MSVYVDNARIPFGRMQMSHMVADSLEELHDMARAIGMRPEWFQNKGIPHYDVSISRRALAIQLGATPVTSRQIVEVIRKVRRLKR